MKSELPNTEEQSAKIQSAEPTDNTGIQGATPEGEPAHTGFSGTIKINSEPIIEHAYDEYGAPEPKFRSQPGF